MVMNVSHLDDFSAGNAEGCAETTSGVGRVMHGGVTSSTLVAEYVHALAKLSPC
jgi:hypothetical protein